MNELTLYIKYFTKAGVALKAVFSKPLSIALSAPVIALPLYSTAEKACGLLAVFFVIDFVTGILASWVEFKKVPPLVPASGKRYLIQSSKLRMSAVKFISYALFILCAWLIESVFVLKEIPAGHISLQNFTLTTIIIALCCVIELYSIFFENIKRMGFDIIQNIKKISSSGWDVYKSVKDDKNGTD